MPCWRRLWQLSAVVGLDCLSTAAAAAPTIPAGQAGQQQSFWWTFGSPTSTTLVPRHLLPGGLSLAAGTMQSAGQGVREGIQQRLVQLQRCRTRMLSLLRESLPGLNEESSSRREGTEAPLSRAARAQAETNQGLREVLSAEARPRTRLVKGILESDERGSRRGKRTALRRSAKSFKIRRGRFGSGLEDMRELVEAAGNHPDIHPEDAADRLRRMLEKNRRELRWHLKKANTLLASWAAQASLEERRMEDNLRAMRERQRDLVSEVKTTAEARLQRAALETQIESVRKEWVERQAVLGDQLKRRQQVIAGKIRSVTSDSKILARIYDDIVLRKQSALETSVMNDRTFRQALELIVEDAKEGGWEQVVCTRNGALSVQRKFMGRDSRGGKFACVRAWCTMEVPAEAIAELFESSERVTEYNKWFLEGRDLDFLDDDTKVVWASSPSVLPFVKPRDFVTVVHVRRLEDGSVVVINRGYRHPDAPPSDDYVRGEVILAANVIRPDLRNKNRAHFTMLTQVDPGGIAPAWLVNKISARDPVDFLERVEAAAGRSESAKTLPTRPESLASGGDLSAREPRRTRHGTTKIRDD